jgi:hypothetical protein
MTVPGAVETRQAYLASATLSDVEKLQKDLLTTWSAIG